MPCKPLNIGWQRSLGSSLSRSLLYKSPVFTGLFCNTPSNLRSPFSRIFTSLLKKSPVFSGPYQKRALFCKISLFCRGAMETTHNLSLNYQALSLPTIECHSMSGAQNSSSLCQDTSNAQPHNPFPDPKVDMYHDSFACATRIYVCV